MKIHVYLSTWHTHTSSAFSNTIINPLRTGANVCLFEYEGQNRRLDAFDASVASVFCMVMPPRGILADPKVNVIWVPMLDWVWNNSQAWWDALPRRIKVIAFSDFVARRCVLAGLSHIRLRYFKDPETCAPTIWNNGNILFYWNRTGLIGFDMLDMLCRSLDAITLIVREQADPHHSAKKLVFPDRIGKAIVSKLPAFMPLEDFYKATQMANVILAPRPIEGIGLTYIERLAMGCAIFAYNAPTMNEYIRHLTNGYLWHVSTPITAEHVKRSAFGKFSLMGNRLAASGIARADKIQQHIRHVIRGNAFEHSVSVKQQNWDEIARLNLRAMGSEARKNHYEGYQEWKKQIPALIHFILHKDHG